MLTKTANQIDWLGFAGSLTCAVHCAVCALIPGIYAVWGLELLAGESTEWFMVAVTCLVAIVGLALNRRLWLAFVFGSGIFILLAARFTEHSLHGHPDAAFYAGIAGTGGGLLIAFAHIMSLKVRPCCESGCPAESGP